MGAALDTAPSRGLRHRLVTSLGLSPSAVAPGVLALLAVTLVGGALGWSMVSTHPLLPFGLLLAIAGGLALVSSPFATMLGFIAVLTIRPAELMPALEPLMLGKLTMAGAILYAILTRLVRRDLSIAKSGMNPYMLWLTVGVAISTALSTERQYSAVMFTDVFVKIVVLYLLIVNLTDTVGRAIALQTALAAFSGFIGGYTIYAKLTSEVLVEGSRAAGVGMLGDPNDTALTLLLVTPFLIAAVLETRGVRRWPFLALLALTLGGIIATQSRGGLIGLVSGALVLVRQRTRSRAVLALFAVVLAIGLAIVAGVAERKGLDTGRLDESAEGRLVAWKAALSMFASKPLFGVGYEAFPFQFMNFATSSVMELKPMAAHNSYVLPLAEVGLAGSIPFFALLGIASWMAVGFMDKAQTTPPGLERALLQGYPGNLMAVLVASFFLSQTWMWFIYILLAQAAAMGRLYDLRFSTRALFGAAMAPRASRR